HTIRNTPLRFIILHFGHRGFTLLCTFIFIIGRLSFLWSYHTGSFQFVLYLQVKFSQNEFSFSLTTYKVQLTDPAIVLETLYLEEIPKQFLLIQMILDVPSIKTYRLSIY